MTAPKAGLWARLKAYVLWKDNVIESQGLTIATYAEACETALAEGERLSEMLDRAHDAVAVLVDLVDTSQAELAVARSKAEELEAQLARYTEEDPS